MTTQPSAAACAPGLRGSSPLPRSVWVFLIALYVLCVASSVLTRDFGFCFDDKYYVESLRVSFDSGVLLPKRYHYPSLGYALSVLAALPSWAAHGFGGKALAAELAQSLGQGLATAPRAALDARVAFAALSHLALFWVALIAWRASRSRLAAGTAALLLALSFEFHYHARIWAPDAPMAQFVLLSVLFAQRYLDEARRRDLLGAAVAAGLAAGTKFPGALALTAVGIAALGLEWSRSGPGERVRALGRVLRVSVLALVVLLLVFVLTTPGVLFDAQMLRDDVSMELRHYRGEGMAGTHVPYGVEAGWDHLRHLCVYVAGQGLSYSLPIALLLSALGLAGVVQLVRRDRLGAALLVSVPLLYAAYFSYQRLMVVRNFEVLLPFLALAVGLGVHALAQGRCPRPVRLAAQLAVALALAWNAWFLIRADASILKRGELDSAAELRRFVESSAEPLFLAPHARELVAPSAANVVADSHAARYAIVLQTDLTEILRRPGFPALELRANWPGIYEPLPEGPWEVNYSYYPTWRGDARPLRISTEYYRRLAGEP